MGQANFLNTSYETRKKLSTVGMLAAVSLVSALVSFRATAADIFVRPATGSGLSMDQRQQVTDLVKRAVRRMPEHTLVQSENMADFVLEPALLTRDGKQVLRVEKFRDGEMLGQSEDGLRTIASSGNQAYAITENALQGQSNDQSGDQSPGLANLDEPQGEPSRGDDGLSPRGSASGTTIDATDVSDDKTSDEVLSDANVESGGAPFTSHDTTSGSTASGDLRAASPIFQRPDTSGYFQLGVGPAVASGLSQNNVLYDINASYNAPINELVIGKAFGDFNLAGGSDPTRFIELGLGAEFYPWRQAILSGTPYLGADLGFAFVRDNLERTQDGLAAGVGGGFKFNASELIVDLSLHYSVLTTQLANNTPSVLDLRAAVNF